MKQLSQRPRTAKRPAKPGEQGYVLLAVMLMLALLIIAMAVAAPKVAKDIQRDREVETMHRGQQYRRAIQLYYRKFNAYPPNMDALVKTNEIRFLRRKYVDPTTGKDEWKPIMFGQNKTPMAMGFFGQPLGGVGATPVAGTGPGSIAGASSLVPQTTTTDPNAAQNPNGQALSDPNSPTGTSTGSTSIGGTSIGGTSIGGTSTSGTSTSGLSGQTFGGGGIIGVSPMSPKQSILVYKKKTHYNEWEFLYSPLSEQQMMGGGNAGTVGAPISGSTNGLTPTPTTTQTPTSTPTPTSPQ